MNHLSSAHWQIKAVVNNMKQILERNMLDPKEVMMQNEDEAVALFEEISGRQPTPEEMKKISEDAYNNIGEYYADQIDRARDMAKGN